jgi:hypothetical protein
VTDIRVKADVDEREAGAMGFVMLLAFYALPFLAVFGAFICIDEPQKRHCWALTCATVAALSPLLNMDIFRANFVGSGALLLFLAALGSLSCLLEKSVPDVPGGLRLRIASFCVCLVYGCGTLFMYMISGLD